MKLTVVRKGVYNKEGERVPVGTVINVKGDKVPGYLVGKVSKYGQHVAPQEPQGGQTLQPATPGKDSAGNGAEGGTGGAWAPPAAENTKLAQLQAEYKTLSGGKEAPAHYKEPGLEKAIEELKKNGGTNNG